MEFDDDRDDRLQTAIERENKIWNNTFKDIDRDKIKYDDWLQMFDRAIDNCKTPIIDLGCGSGNDTLYLIEKGKEVIPCDYSKVAIEKIKNNFPEIERTECFDMSKGLPFKDNLTDIIISDLSLHYFTEEKTFEILDEIKRVLRPNGLLFFRVNSLISAGEGKEIESHLYQTDNGRYKRFFDRRDIDKFFFGWERLYIHEETMGRYGHEKVLWKGAMQVKK